VMALSRLFDEASVLNLYNSIDFTRSWDLFWGTLQLEDRFFSAPSLRPELTAVSMCNFLGSLSGITYQTAESSRSRTAPRDEIIRVFNLCLSRTEESVLQAIPRTAQTVLELLSTASPEAMIEVVSSWLANLENEQSYNRLRGSGYAIALGAAYPQLSTPVPEETAPSPTADQMRIVTALTLRCTPKVDIAARTVALSALSVLLEKHKIQKPSEPLPEEVKVKIISALNSATNDYTVTERGDVGSLVRLEALNTIETGWKLGLIEASAIGEQIHAGVLRLSLEKLDKIRTRAAHVLEVGNTEHFERYVSARTKNLPHLVARMILISFQVLSKTSSMASLPPSISPLPFRSSRNLQHPP
jgi:tubulin-specific chaperone D